MNTEVSNQQGEDRQEIKERRCPECDTVVNDGDRDCPMCGRSLSGSNIVSSVLIERRSRLTTWMNWTGLVIIVLMGFLVVRNPAPLFLAVLPSLTPLPVVPTATSTRETSTEDNRPATLLPEDTPTSVASPTPRPPRTHIVTAGETLFGLGLRYDVSAESIASANQILPSAGVQVNQDLVIPWPTPTPPLVAVAVEINGQTIMADPAGCKRVEIRGGDTLFGIAARERVDLRALLAVNRLTEQSILQPGDDVCVPTIIRGGVLPPTPGPSPTPSETPRPAGPILLQPPNNAVFDYPPDRLAFQWVAVKDLDDDESYMVEITDLTNPDGHPYRGFTRQNSFRPPVDWFDSDEEDHDYRWRVRIVRITGLREDGEPIFTYGGRESENRFFEVNGG